MNLSCCIWALSGPEEETLASLAETGFRVIDIRPTELRDTLAWSKAQELGLQVSCIGASFGLPEGATLDSLEADAAGHALAHVQKALEHGAERGASVAYVIPGLDPGREALARYAETLTEAAGHAEMLGLKLCIEHFPGRALPTAAATLNFLQEVGHPNLYLLFDIGHIQMSQEDPVTILKAAAGRLGYVHLDDNDGVNDQHLSLLDGVLTEAVLEQTLRTLEEINYPGTVSLELNPALSDPLAALRESREIMLRVMRET
jgi:D-psicose/D-tagatose/L-ribulose 3-epimerase